MKYCEYEDVPNFKRQRIKEWKEVVGDIYFIQQPDKSFLQARYKISNIDHFKKWFEQENWVHDCDGGHEYTYYAGVKIGNEYTFLKVIHEFYAYWGSPQYEDDNGFRCKNSFEFEEIEKPEWFPLDRDYIIV